MVLRKSILFIQTLASQKTLLKLQVVQLMHSSLFNILIVIFLSIPSYDHLYTTTVNEHAISFVHQIDELIVSQY